MEYSYCIVGTPGPLGSKDLMRRSREPLRYTLQEQQPKKDLEMDILDELEAQASTVHGGAYAVMMKARKEIKGLRQELAAQMPKTPTAKPADTGEQAPAALTRKDLQKADVPTLVQYLESLGYLTSSTEGVRKLRASAVAVWNTLNIEKETPDE